MFRRTTLSSSLALAFGSTLLLLSGAGVRADDQTQRVEITGSSIKRIAGETALPVQVVTRIDIERSGAKSVTDLIQSLPAMQGFTQTSQSVGGGGGGYSDATIHGIGGGPNSTPRTLVLLNGRRIATWAGQTLTGAGSGIDLNGIPLAAVERVEVLTDGASAIYGTDAIAGVVNFILRRDLTVGEISANMTVPRGSVGKSQSISAAKGWGDVESDGYNAMFAASYSRQDQMKATDRSFSKTGVIPFSNDGKNYIFFNGSIRGVPANYEVADHATGGNVRDILGSPYLDANGKCPPVHVLRGGACRFDYTSTIESLPESEQSSLFGSFSRKINPDTTFNLDLVYSDFWLVSRIAPPPVDMQIPTGSSLYNQYMPGGPNAIPGSVMGDDLYAYWRGVDVGNRTTKNRTKALHLAGELTGKVGAWDYTGDVTHSESKWVETYISGWLMQNEQDAAIANGSFNPFLDVGKQSTAGNNALAGMQYRGIYKSESSMLDAAELKMQHALFDLDGGQAQLGIGVDLRRETVRYSPSDIAQGLTNNIAGDSAQEKGFNVSRQIWGLYSELFAPITKKFEMSGAFRMDHYADFGEADNVKLSAKYQPAKGVLIRGAFGTGFHAPSVPQVAASKQHYGVTGNTYNCPAAALAALKAIDPAAVCRPDGIQYDIMASGNANLKPERSQQFTFGFRFEPVEWASIGADFWRVMIKDRIGQLAEKTVVENDAAYLKNFDIFIDPGTHQHYLALFLPNENLGKEKYNGVDIDGRFVFDTGIGKVSSTALWTHMFGYDYQRVKGGDWFSSLGSYNDGSVTFRNLIKVSTTLKTGPFENTLAVNYKSGYLDEPCTAIDCGLVRLQKADGTPGAVVDMTNHMVKSYSTIDWQIRYAFTKSLTLTGGILNLFDQNPPLTLKTDGGHQLGYDNRYTDPRGRTFYLTAGFKF